MKKVLLSLMVLAMLTISTGCGTKEMGTPADSVQTEDGSGEQNPEVTQEAVAVKPTKEPEKFEFPVLLDEDRLELGSVFEFTGMNPDDEDVYQEEVGAIQLKNVSGQYLKEAKLHVTLSNGDSMEFLVKDVPADMELMAFDVDSTIYDDTHRVETIEVEAVYEETDAAELFTWSVNGSEITVENISGQKLKDVAVQYHCTIDGLGYGGSSYAQELGTMEPGEIVTVSDYYCFVGDVTVVNVTHR